MKQTLIALFVLLMSVIAFAKDKPAPKVVSPEAVAATAQRAANAVPALRASMRDPDSFVLEGVYMFFFKRDGDQPTVCYLYRAHNAYGGYANSGVARLDIHGTLKGFGEAVDPDGWNMNMCSADMLRNYINITAEVNALLHPPAPVAPSVSPADAAKQAQQYADCLKIAVNNSSIVCKQ